MKNISIESNISSSSCLLACLLFLCYHLIPTVLLFQGHRLTAFQVLCIAVVLGFPSLLCVDYFLKMFPSFAVLLHLVEQIMHWKAIF